MDNARADELNRRLWHLIYSSRDAQGDVAEFIEQEGPDDVCRVYALWVASAMGIFNLAAPVEEGFAMMPDQLAGTHDLVMKMAQGRTTPGVQAVKEAYTLTSHGQHREVGAEFARVWAGNARDGADMVVIAALVLKMAQQANGWALTKLVTRAAELRSRLADVRDECRETEWCPKCLPQAMRVVDMAGERPVAPMGDRVTSGEDMSFLAGIDLGGFDG